MDALLLYTVCSLPLEPHTMADVSARSRSHGSDGGFELCWGSWAYAVLRRLLGGSCGVDARHGRRAYVETFLCRFVRSDVSRVRGWLPRLVVNWSRFRESVFLSAIFGPSKGSMSVLVSDWLRRLGTQSLVGVSQIFW